VLRGVNEVSVNELMKNGKYHTRVFEMTLAEDNLLWRRSLLYVSMRYADHGHRNGGKSMIEVSISSDKLIRSVKQ
jgi:hypothetical protein